MSFLIHRNIVFKENTTFFSKNVLNNQKITNKISEIDQLMTYNQHVFDALRRVFGRFNMSTSSFYYYCSNQNLAYCKCMFGNQFTDS